MLLAETKAETTVHDLYDLSQSETVWKLNDLGF